MATDVKYLISLQDQNVSRKLSTLDKQTQRFDKSLGRTIGRFAAFAAVGTILTTSVKKMADFEEQVSNLSAITGLAGQDLDFLSRKAIELGGATTKSSIDTVKAFKLIASAKPDLLTNAQALAAVTKEAITLSEASGLDLPNAATSLTDSLNQFNLSADQSSRVINVLAAGSKFAAAEIPDLTMSLKEFGGVADSLNISLEQSAAAVETLSSKGLKGQRAGIQLRNVLLKLGASTDKKVNPKIVGLSKALENLKGIQDDTSKLTKMFGRQNVLAAQTLIKQRDRFNELTEAMTETNVAYEQARVNTDNLNSDVKRLGSSWEKFVLHLNSGSGVITNALRSIVQTASDVIDMLDDINQGISLRNQQGRATIGYNDRLAKSEEKINELIDKRMKMDDISRESAINRIRSQIQESVKAKKIALSLAKGELGKGRERGILMANIELQNEQLKLLDKIQKGETNITPTSVKPEVKGIKDVQDEVTKITSAAPKVFNINIESFVKEFQVNSKTVKDGAAQTRDEFIDMWTKMLLDVQAVGGG